MIGLFTFILCLTALSVAFLVLPRERRTKKAAAVFLLIALGFEIGIANFHSYVLWFGDYEPATFLMDSRHVSVSQSAVREDSGVSNSEGQPITVRIADIDRPVGTVCLQVKLLNDTDYVDVSIDAMDITHAAAYRRNVADGRIVDGYSRSSYIVLNLSGEVSDLKITLTPPEHGQFILSGVDVNQSVPFHLSGLRLSVTVLAGMAVFFLCTSLSMKSEYKQDSRALRRTAYSMMAVFMVAALVITYISMYDRTGKCSEGFNSTWGNQISKEIVDAFRAGRADLLYTPSPELLAMENPYDWSARSVQGVTAKWDHLLFNGKYYSYYGIAPVLLLFLPYNLLTGFYFPTAEAVLIFGVLGILFLTLLFLEFAELFCKKIPNSILLSTLFIILMSCGVWYNFVYDNFYEIAQSSGFAFTCMGFYFLLRSRVIGEGKIQYRHIVLSTLCLSLAVLCRPTLALYCPVACIFLGFGFIKHRREIREAAPKKRPAATAKYLAASLTCFVIIGGVQMVYNYVRFGSVLDFGIQYSLTINDFVNAQYHTDFTMIGFYNFLLAFPLIQPRFPYVFSNFSTLSVNGYYFVANTNAVGLFWRALPSLGYFCAVPAWKALNKEERIKAVLLLVPCCLIAPLVIIFSIWESGYGVRYCCDFTWQFILGGAAVLYLLYVRVAQGQGRTLLRHAFTVAAMLAFAVNGAMIYEYLSKSGYLADVYLRLESIFNFWM